MDGGLGDHGQAVGEVALELVSHYRLRDKPARTLETLRIFLRNQADEVVAELRAGRAVVVRRGPRHELESLARGLMAQGFSLRLLPAG